VSDRAQSLPVPGPPPLVVAVEMGYGHVRAGRALADACGVPVVHADRAPVADAADRARWRRTRLAYEATSRISQLPVVGAPLRWVLDELTDIPHLHPFRDLSAPTRGARALDALVRRGLGQGLVEELRRTGRPLLTTFFAPAILADRAGLSGVYCVVTDSDVNRAWAPVDAKATRIRYLVPTHRAGRRLEAYGVPPAQITFTGFPLPHELVGGAGLAPLLANLRGRLVRLDPTGAFRREQGDLLAHVLGALPAEEERRSPLLTFAVGGAGAQAGLARQFLPSLRPALLGGRLRVALVAGVRVDVRDALAEAIAGAGLAGAVGETVEVLFEPELDAYLSAMNRLLARTDVLWTKPSELCFYAALGIPLVLAPPVGAHERINRRWVRESGAGFKQRDARCASDWLSDLLVDGSLAAAAWAGFTRLPRFGTYRILEALGAAAPGASAPDRSALRLQPAPAPAVGGTLAGGGGRWD
jgi:hypothetical protein